MSKITARKYTMSRSLSQTSIAIFSLTLGGLSFACKSGRGSSESKPASLDNFASGQETAERINQCGVKFEGGPLPGIWAERSESIQTPSDALKNVAIGVMQGIPKNLIDSFFASSGRILISENFKALCANSINQSEREFAHLSSEGPRSCWRQPHENEPPEIVIAPTKVDIQHSLLRMFGYVFSQYLVTRAKISSGDPFNSDQWKEAMKGFDEAKSDLGLALLDDLKALDKKSIVEKMEKFRLSDQQNFDNFVTAEAIDSYYCSARTRDIFQKQFPRSFFVFTDQSNRHSMVYQFGDVN